jgi:hypothetical protein
MDVEVDHTAVIDSTHPRPRGVPMFFLTFKDHLITVAPEAVLIDGQPFASFPIPAWQVVAEIKKRTLTVLADGEPIASTNLRTLPANPQKPQP